MTLFRARVIRINPKDRIYHVEGLLAIHFLEVSFHMSDQTKTKLKNNSLGFFFSCCYSLLNKLWYRKYYYFPSTREIWTIIRRVKAFWWLSKLGLVQQWNWKNKASCLPCCFNCLITVCSQRPEEIIVTSRQSNHPGPDEKQRPTWDVTAHINCFSY